jgi:hypothetical protein
MYAHAQLERRNRLTTGNESSENQVLADAGVNSVRERRAKAGSNGGVVLASRTPQLML